MRLATVLYEGTPRVVAALADEMLLDLDKAATFARYETDTFTNMLAVIQVGDYGLEQARGLLRRADRRALLSISGVIFCPPVMPLQFRNAETVEAAARRRLSAPVPDVWRKAPHYSPGYRMGFAGHGAIAAWRGYAALMDVDPALAIVLGQTGRGLPVAAAPGYIFGYALLASYVARDVERREAAVGFGPCCGR